MAAETKEKKSAADEDNPRYQLGKIHATQGRPPAELTDVYLHGYAEGVKIRKRRITF